MLLLSSLFSLQNIKRPQIFHRLRWLMVKRESRIGKNVLQHWWRNHSNSCIFIVLWLPNHGRLKVSWSLKSELFRQKKNHYGAIRKCIFLGFTLLSWLNRNNVYNLMAKYFCLSWNHLSIFVRIGTFWTLRQNLQFQIYKNLNLLDFTTNFAVPKSTKLYHDEVTIPIPSQNAALRGTNSIVKSKG